MVKKEIICDKKIDELNKLCYPEDRMPYKTIKDVEDLSFRDIVTAEKYIKARQKRRNFRDKIYTYDDILDCISRDTHNLEEAQAYLESFKKLEKKLLSIGGYEVVFAADCVLDELKKILRRGQFLDGRKFKRSQGEIGRCHENSIYGWEVNKDRAIVMCGYALTEDGYWVFHSWLINVKMDSQPLETTPVKRQAYFGYALNLKECEDLLSVY